MEFVTSIVCSVKSHDCCNDVCSNCPRRDMLNEVILHLKSLPEVTYNKWVQRSNIYEKAILCESGVAVADQFDEIATKYFKLHVYNIFRQYSELKFLKRNLIDNDVIFSVDFWRNNYDNKHFHEIQSAYFGHETFTLFTAACYVKGSNTDYNFKSNIDKDTGLTVIPVVIVSNQTVHERNIAF